MVCRLEVGILFSLPCLKPLVVFYNLSWRSSTGRLKWEAFFGGKLIYKAAKSKLLMRRQFVVFSALFHIYILQTFEKLFCLFLSSFLKFSSSSIVSLFLLLFFSSYLFYFSHSLFPFLSLLYRCLYFSITLLYNFISFSQLLVALSISFLDSLSPFCLYKNMRRLQRRWDTVDSHFGKFIITHFIPVLSTYFSGSS